MLNIHTHVPYVRSSTINFSSSRVLGNSLSFLMNVSAFLLEEEGSVTHMFPFLPLQPGTSELHFALRCSSSSSLRLSGTPDLPLQYESLILFFSFPLLSWFYFCLLLNVISRSFCKKDEEK